MKLKCDVCEKEEAEVLCCADEAVLCKMCDSKVHAANLLSRKHHRLHLLNQLTSSYSSSSSSLTSSSSHLHLPVCDSCKVTKAHVFCLEDRALLCPNCDVSTHSASKYSASHQRFLMSGIRVALRSSAERCSSEIGSSSDYSHRQMNPSSAETTRASLAHLTDEPGGFPAETDWPFNQHFCDTTDDIVFNNFSDAAAAFGFNDG